MSKMQRHIGVHMSDDEMKLYEGAETGAFKSPIPTQVISNGEWNAPPQSAQQKQVENLIKEMGDTNAKRNGLSRRDFLASSAGMATCWARSCLDGSSSLVVAIFWASPMACSM